MPLLSRLATRRRRLAKEQETFLRLASLVARGAPPAQLFKAFADEIGRSLPGERVALGRYERDGSLSPVAACAKRRAGHRADAREILEAAGLRPEAGSTATPAPASEGRGMAGPGGTSRNCSAVAVPVQVEGRLWGVMVACSRRKVPLEGRTRARLAGFAELIATVIANAESRAALAASRTRVVAAFDEARRRIERDLHDGAQQRLVSLALGLRAAQAAVPAELTQVHAELSALAEGMDGLLEDLRTMARGIHPAILDSGGLGPALKTLARRSAVPVELEVETNGRLPERVEVAAYYVVSESLANVAKHAQATVARVDVALREGRLWVRVRDDGRGGADPTRGSGLTGLWDRVEALGGTLRLTSPTGGGTTVEAVLPLEVPPAADGAA